MFMTCFTYIQFFIKWLHWMIQFCKENEIFFMLKQFNTALILASMAYSANIMSLLYLQKEILNLVNLFFSLWYLFFDILCISGFSRYLLLLYSNCNAGFSWYLLLLYSNCNAGFSWWLLFWHSICCSGLSLYFAFWCFILLSGFSDIYIFHMPAASQDLCISWYLALWYVIFDIQFSTYFSLFTV